MTLTAHEVVLFACNTGALYDTQKALVGQPLSAWTDHVCDVVLPLYRRQFGPQRFSAFETVEAAAALRDYYQRHVSESDALKHVDGA